MKIFLKVCIILLILTFILVGGRHFSEDLFIQKEQLAMEVNAKVNQVAPDFVLKATDGNIYSLTSYLGKKVVINFWAAWCPPCKEELPAIQEFYEQNLKNVVLLSINSDPDYAFDKLLKEYGITFPVLLDKNSKIANKYRVLSIPTTFILDEYGKIAYIHYGTVTKEKLNALLE